MNFRTLELPKQPKNFRTRKEFSYSQRVIVLANNYRTIFFSEFKRSYVPTKTILNSLSFPGVI